MKLNLRTKMILAIMGFLVITLGSSMVVYTLFADEYYAYVTKGVVEDIYKEIKKLPIENPISDEAAERLETLSEGGVSILICDSENELVFSTKKRDNRSVIFHYVKQRKDLYTKQPKAIARENRVDLYGILDEESVYYVYVWQNMSGIQNTVKHTRNLFLIFVLITILFAALIVGLWAGRLVSLIKEIGILTRKIARGDFSKYRIKSYIPNDELGELVRDIDAMSEIIENDISTLQNYNYLLKERTERIEKYQALNQEYITTITHDLKTPLAIIGSQVEMMGLSDDPVKKQYYVESIQDEIDKMSERISEVLKNSVIERSLKNMVLKKTDLQEYMRNISVKYEAWMKLEKIDYSYSMEEACYAMIEEESMEHAINNYVMNAFHHTEPGGKIQLRLTCDDRFCEISVVNEGKPIAEEHMEEIWDKYYQYMEKSEGRQSAYGVGLGLQIVKEIVVMHDGEYGVKNVAGGVCFYIRLPRVKE